MGARRSRLLTPSGLVLAGLLALFGSAHAQDALLDRAGALVAQHDPAAAFALLAPQEEQRSGDPRFDYLLGVAALDSGHLTRAIFAFERILAVRPDDAPARAELARAYLAAGETDSARRELQQVRSKPLPEGVGPAIDRVLGIIDQVAPRAGVRLSGYLEVGGGFDSNVNSATNQGEFAVPAFGGLLFANGAESQRRSDWFALASGGVLAQFSLDSAWKIVAAIDARSTIDRRVHDMNTDLVDATLALNHTAAAQSQTVALQNSTAWVGSGVYRTANGASGQWQMQLDAVSQASAFVQWSRQEYAGQAERNTDRSVLGLGYARKIDSIATLVYGSAYLADERARQEGFEYYGHHAAGLRIGVERNQGAAAVVFAEWQHERRIYGGAEPLFEVGRDDRQDDLSAGVRLAVAPGWQLVPHIRFSRAASNVVIYDYSRTVYQVTLRREFP